MAILYHPPQGAIVTVQFEPGFKAPEMVKRRPCIVLSKPMKHRPDLLTVVALSTTAPGVVLPYHLQLDIPFEMPPRWSGSCWVKGDMINTVGFHRTDLIALGKDRTGKRIYQVQPLPSMLMEKVRTAVLTGLGLSP